MARRGGVGGTHTHGSSLMNEILLARTCCVIGLRATLASEKSVEFCYASGFVTRTLGAGSGRCMEIAGLIDQDQNWIGGTTHFVQIGDILDRGDDEKDCLQLLRKLRPQVRGREEERG